MKARVQGLLAVGPLAGPMAAQAVVVYQFSLAANGGVGPIAVRLTAGDFIPVGDLAATALDNPSISFTSGTPLSAAESLIGFDQDATESLFGIAMVDPVSGGWALLTRDYTGFVPSGDGTPFSNVVANETSPHIQYAMENWWSWYPVGLGAFGAQMTGNLLVKATGSYPFALTSDDGSRLYVDGQLALDNGGDHGPGTVLTIMKLSAGYHPFVLNYWQNGFGASGVDLAIPDGVEFGDASAADATPLLQQLLSDVTGVGPGKSLANKVKLMQTYYVVRDSQATCAVLTDFATAVRAQQGKKIQAGLAEESLGDARAIMLVIGCN